MQIEKIFNQELTLYILQHGYPDLSNARHIGLFELMIAKVYARCQLLGHGYRTILRTLRTMHLAGNFTGDYLCFLALDQHGVKHKDQILKEIAE